MLTHDESYSGSPSLSPCPNPGSLSCKLSIPDRRRVATGKSTVILSKKSLKIALHESLEYFPTCNFRQRFNNGHIVLWQSRSFCHACILWVLLQYRATLQKLHFSMCASFGQAFDGTFGNGVALVSRSRASIPRA